MNINELVTEHPNVTLNVRAEDLTRILDEAIQKAKREFAPKKEETYLSVTKATEMLGVDRSTLWRWAKSGYLTPVEVGGKRRYRMSDIEKILEGAV